MGGVGHKDVCVCLMHVCRKKKPLSPASFKYTVRLTKDVGSEPFTVRASQIR